MQSKGSLNCGRKTEKNHDRLRAETYKSRVYNLVDVFQPMRKNLFKDVRTKIF